MHKIMRYCLYYSTKSSFSSERNLTKISLLKLFVPQFKIMRGIFEGAALKYFYMIHKGGRYRPPMNHVKIFKSRPRRNACTKFSAGCINEGSIEGSIKVGLGISRTNEDSQ